MSIWPHNVRPGESSESPDDPGRTLLASGALHEAGHAILTLALGFSFVEIVFSLGGPNQVKFPDDHLPGERADRILITVAGVVAQAMQTEGLDWWSLLETQGDPDGDLGIIASLLGHPENNVTRRELEPYVAEAEGLLNKHLQALKALAARLLATGRVPYDEALSIYKRKP